MNLVVIESPYAGDVERNVAYARAAMKDSLARGEAPLASHLLYPGVLDDGIGNERALGIAAGLRLGSRCDSVAFYVDLGWSGGMRSALDHWHALGMAMEERTLPDWKLPERVATWVRARDLAVYKNPVVTFPEGHVEFRAGAALLVLWEPVGASPMAVLDRVIGHGGWGPGPDTPRTEHVAVPGLPAPSYSPAFVYPFHLGRRIPAPTHSDGFERYPSRIRGAHVLEFLHSPLDNHAGAQP